MIQDAGLGQALGTDFFSVREQFTPEQWSAFTAVRRFVDTEVIPVAGGYWERAELCWPLIRRLPELGIVGEDIAGYGCAGLSPLACGLVTMELHRGDGSLRGVLGVHSGLAMRSIWQADITLDNVRVPAANRLPGARSFKDAGRVLAATRSTCAWAALGHATAAYDAALRYALHRHQFGRPLASFQIIQQRLVSMLADLTAMQLYCMQIGRLAEDGQLTATVAGLAKMHNTRKARLLAAEARDMLGGNGILLDNHVIRHMADLEASHTVEGTETMQTLIVGRDITG